MNERNAYVEKYQAKLNQWDSEMENLRAKASEASADARIALNRQIEMLEAQQKEAQGKLDDLRDKAEDKWIDSKYAVERAYNDFDTTVRKTIEKLAA